MRTGCNLRTASLIVSLAVLLSLATPVFAQGEKGMAPIAPAVLGEFDAKGEATFWVLFREQADLSPAFAIRDWNQRGRFVYERLVGTAESSQARVRALLGATGAETRPFWIVNMIEVRTDNTTLPSLLAANSPR